MSTEYFLASVWLIWSSSSFLGQIATLIYPVDTYQITDLYFSSLVVFPTAADYSTANNGSFNYSCSLSPNSQSSSSSEVQSSPPTYPVSTTSLLAQTQCIAPILPVLAAAAGSSTKASLPFKLRHKQAGNPPGPPQVTERSATEGTSGDPATTHHDSDASSDSSVPAINNIELNSGQFEAGRENTASPDSMLKTENFALKSELQRLASEVATLKNVLVYSSHTSATSQVHKAHSDRCNPYPQRRSPVHYSEDLVDDKSLLTNVIKFPKLNDIIV